MTQTNAHQIKTAGADFLAAVNGNTLPTGQEAKDLLALRDFTQNPDAVHSLKALWDNRAQPTLQFLTDRETLRNLISHPGGAELAMDVLKSVGLKDKVALLSTDTAVEMLAENGYMNDIATITGWLDTQEQATIFVAENATATFMNHGKVDMVLDAFDEVTREDTSSALAQKILRTLMIEKYSLKHNGQDDRIPTIINRIDDPYQGRFGPTLA